MADSYTTLNPGSGGDLIDEELVNFNSGAYFAKRGRIVIEGNTQAALAPVANTAPTGTEYGLYTRNVGTTTVTVSNPVNTVTIGNSPTVTVANSPTTYQVGTITSLMTTELNSLANNALVLSSVGGTSGVFSLTNYTFGQVELVVTFGTAPTANTTISVWFLCDLDGTNYEDGSSSITPVRNPDVVFPVRAVTTAQRIQKWAKLPMTSFKVLALNNGTGQGLAASANTIKILPGTYSI